MTTSTAHAVNALLARLFQEPELLQRLRADPQAVFQEAGLSQEECAALTEGSFGALDRISVHPVLRMHYQMASKPEIAEHVTIREFLPTLLKERRHG
jgi:hypothetical protein